MARRKIVQIDQQKCDGCGLCIPACAEGALQIVEGKARLVADVYCDGLGACLGECPQDAITIVERDAEAFDEEATRQQAARLRTSGSAGESGERPAPAACPGSTAVELKLDPIKPQSTPSAQPSSEGAPPTYSAGRDLHPAEGTAPSRLGNWPVQLHLVPPHAPFLKNADLLLVADCVPFALADFHTRFLGKRPVVIGCPKLDDASLYVERLTQIMATAEINSVTVIQMEVPCCTRLVRIAESAMRSSGREIPLEEVTVSIRGRIISPGSPE
ncbi:MAG: ATP-binding protein [Planctomycetota bacterium]|jgi:Pyruvate/2-oxoacid:ferredoxin oxidoreductase delta subunit